MRFENPYVFCKILTIHTFKNITRLNIRINEEFLVSENYQSVLRVIQRNSIYLIYSCINLGEHKISVYKCKHQTNTSLTTEYSILLFWLH